MTDEFTQHSTEMCIDNEETWRSFLYQDMLYFSYNLVHTKKTSMSSLKRQLKEFTNKNIKDKSMSSVYVGVFLAV